MSKELDEMREKIAKTDYEFGSPKSYFDWDKLSDKDRAWYLRLAKQILSLETDTCRIKIMPQTRIVCLCGSTRFMDAFFDAGWEFTLKGYIVLSVGVCKHAEHHGAEALGQDVVDKLDELHLRKIDLADEVMILNVDGYIGESTRKEIEYAKLLGKPINYLEK